MCCWAPALPRCPQLRSAPLRGALPCPTALCPDLGTGQPSAGPPLLLPRSQPWRSLVPGLWQRSWSSSGPLGAHSQGPAGLRSHRPLCPCPRWLSSAHPLRAPTCPRGCERLQGSRGQPPAAPQPQARPFPALLGVVHMPVLTAELVGGNLAAAVGTVVKCFTEIRACCIYHFSFCLLEFTIKYSQLCPCFTFRKPPLLIPGAILSLPAGVPRAASFPWRRLRQAGPRHCHSCCPALFRKQLLCPSHRQEQSLPPALIKGGVPGGCRGGCSGWVLCPGGPRLQPPQPVLPQEELLWGLGAERGRCPQVRSFCLPREQLPALRGLVLVPPHSPAAVLVSQGWQRGCWLSMGAPPSATTGDEISALPRTACPPPRQPKPTPCFALGTGREVWVK